MFGASAPHTPQNPFLVQDDYMLGWTSVLRKTCAFGTFLSPAKLTPLTDELLHGGCCLVSGTKVKWAKDSLCLSETGQETGQRGPRFWVWVQLCTECSFSYRQKGERECLFTLKLMWLWLWWGGIWAIRTTVGSFLWALRRALWAASAGGAQPKLWNTERKDLPGCCVVPPGSRWVC